MLGQWEQWIADEDRYLERDDPVGYADLIIAGTQTIDYDPDHEVIVLRQGSRLGR
jgi:hypothetical protein